MSARATSPARVCSRCWSVGLCGRALDCQSAISGSRPIAVDHALGEMTYVRLLPDRQQNLWANDAESESFHPGQTALEMIDLPQRTRLTALCPGLDENRVAYAGHARRVLSRPETEILSFERPGGH